MLNALTFTLMDRFQFEELFRRVGIDLWTRLVGSWVAKSTGFEDLLIRTFKGFAGGIFRILDLSIERIKAEEHRVFSPKIRT